MPSSRIDGVIAVELCDGRRMTRRLVAILGALFWGASVLSGVSVISGVARQAVPGYPNVGQVRYYIWFPATMFSLNVCLAFFAQRTPTPFFALIWLIQLALVLPFLLGYTGEM